MRTELTGINPVLLLFFFLCGPAGWRVDGLAGASRDRKADPKRRLEDENECANSGTFFSSEKQIQNKTKTKKEKSQFPSSSLYQGNRAERECGAKAEKGHGGRSPLTTVWQQSTLSALCRKSTQAVAAATWMQNLRSGTSSTRQHLFHPGGVCVCVCSCSPPYRRS